MKKSWSFTDMYGKEHSIVYKAGFGLKLIVDGTTYKLKSQNWFVNVVDYSIEIAGSDIRLVAIKRAMGRTLETSGTEYGELVRYGSYHYK